MDILNIFGDCPQVDATRPLIISQHRFRLCLGAVRQQDIYLSQFWPSLLTLYGITRPQWVKDIIGNHEFEHLRHILNCPPPPPPPKKKNLLNTYNKHPKLHLAMLWQDVMTITPNIFVLFCDVAVCGSSEVSLVYPCHLGFFNWHYCIYNNHTIAPVPATWWRHKMETFSALLALCAGNPPVTGEFPTQRPVTRSFGVFFDLRLNKRLSRQAWGWWFEMPLCSLWCHCNGSNPGEYE